MPTAVPFHQHPRINANNLGILAEEQRGCYTEYSTPYEILCHQEKSISSPDSHSICSYEQHHYVSPGGDGQNAPTSIIRSIAIPFSFHPTGFHLASSDGHTDRGLSFVTPDLYGSDLWFGSISFLKRVASVSWTMHSSKDRESDMPTSLPANHSDRRTRSISSACYHTCVFLYKYSDRDSCHKRLLLASTISLLKIL